MDQYYHHHRPYHQWRQQPPLQQPSLCPLCSIPHFPFCPPYPPYHHQNPNYPPQHPNYARPGFDPYQPPPPPPPPHINGFADPRSWHPNPNYGCDYATAGGTDIDRSYKRARIEEIGSGPARILTEDERRLKLIRDHGATSVSGFNQENKPLPDDTNNNNNVNLMPPRSSEMYNIEDSLNNCTDYYGNNNYNYNQLQQIQLKDSVATSVNHWQGYEQRIGGYLLHLGGNHMAQTPPPLPASPPPPLPVEAYSSSPNSSFSLFPIGVSASVTAHSTYPVVSEPYYQNKPPPHASGGHREVMACF